MHSCKMKSQIKQLRVTSGKEEPRIECIYFSDVLK